MRDSSVTSRLARAAAIVLGTLVAVLILLLDRDVGQRDVDDVDRDDEQRLSQGRDVGSVFLRGSGDTGRSALGLEVGEVETSSGYSLSGQVVSVNDGTGVDLEGVQMFERGQRDVLASSIHSRLGLFVLRTEGEWRPEVDLCIRLKGGAVLRKGVAWGERPGDKIVTLEAGPLYFSDIRVIDARTGSPVGQAVVSNGHGDELGRTNGGGEVVVAICEGESGVLTIRAQGYCAIERRFGPSVMERNQQVELTAGASIRGQVVDQTGSAIASGDVVLIATSRDHPKNRKADVTNVWEPPGYRMTQRVTIGADGRFESNSMPLDAIGMTYTVVVDAPGYLRGTFGGIESQGAADTDAGQFELTAASRVVGLVTYGGAPVVAAVDVEFGEPAKGQATRQHLFTNSQGLCKIEGVPPGAELRVRASIPTSPLIAGVATVVLNRAHEGTFSIEIDTEIETVACRIEEFGGRLLPDVTVAVKSPSEAFAFPKTDESGRFEVDVLTSEVAEVQISILEREAEYMERLGALARGEGGEFVMQCAAVERVGFRCVLPDGRSPRRLPRELAYRSDGDSEWRIAEPIIKEDGVYWAVVPVGTIDIAIKKSSAGQTEWVRVDTVRVRRRESGESPVEYMLEFEWAQRRSAGRH